MRSTCTGFAPGTTGGTSVCTCAATDAARITTKLSVITQTNLMSLIVVLLSHPFNVTLARSGSSKQSGSEVFQIAPPCLPFVVGAGGFVIDMFDASAIQRFVEIVNALIHPLRFFRADAYPHQTHFFIAGRCV